MALLETLKELKLVKLIVLAIILRFLVMPFYFHPDIKTYHFQVSFLGQGVTDIYSYLITERLKLPMKEEFVYFPLTYFFLGSYQITVSPLLGSNFPDWLSDPSQTANDKIGVFRYLFILKFPYLIFDLAAAFLLMSFFEKAQQKRKALLLWLFNPFSIFIIYAYGNFDIIPVTFTLMSLVLAKRSRLILAALLLGIGIAFKLYPLLLLPFLILEGRNLREKSFIVLAGIGPALITALPFLLSRYFWQSALVSGLTTRIVYPDFGIGFGESIMVAVSALTALYFYRITKESENRQIIWKYYLAVLLLLFSFIHFHIQWLIWLIPLVIILMVKESRITVPGFLLIGAAFIIPLFYDDKSMTVSLLSSISRLFNLVPTPFVVAQKFYNPFLIQSIFHSILAGGSLLLIWQLFKYQKELE